MNEDWELVVAQGEKQNVDFKAAMAWDRESQISLAKDIVAMSNTRDGGLLLIGVAEGEDGRARVDGVTPEQSASFEPTKICEYVARFFRPTVSLSVERPTVAGTQIVVIRISDFSVTPVVCTSDGPEKPLKNGNRYFYAGNVFARTVAAKSEVIRTAEDMLALIRLGVTKTSNQLLSDFRQVLEGTALSVPAEPAPHDHAIALWTQAFGDRREEWKQRWPTLGAIDMVFLPDRAEGDALDHAAMRRLVQDARVTSGGWSLPAEAYETKFCKFRNRVDAVECGFERDADPELWQLHKSGAFMYGGMLRYHEDHQDGLILPFEGVIYVVALGFIFAQRLYESMAPHAALSFTFRLTGVKQSRLGTFDKFRRRLHDEYRTSDDTITIRGTTTVLELRAGWRGVAQRVVKDMFVLFNWEIHPTNLTQRLDEIEGKRS
ncbi:MAG: ATP-binding protein [Kofleriaceae bacterium]